MSRLAPNTSPSSLKRHIKESCNITAHCVAIKTTYDSYCSFRVFAESNLDSSMWPTGVLVRDFISSISAVACTRLVHRAFIVFAIVRYHND